MVWVQREHAGALAVLSAWLSGLLPWNVTYSTDGSIWVLFVRFPLFEFQYTSGLGPGIDGASLRTVLSAIQIQSGQGLESATLVWGGGAVVILAALLLSVVYYADESWSDSLSVHPIRLMGGLLGAAAVLFGIATRFVWTGGFGGTPIPVGVPLVAALAWVLLTAELTDDSDPETDDVSAS